MKTVLMVVGCALVAAAGAGDANGDLRIPPEAAERRFLDVSWRRTVVVEGALDSDLLRPELMVARDSTVFVYDYGDHSVKAFGNTGALIWTFGREGRGPGEFVNPTDLKLHQDGTIWIVDPALSRITVVSGRGRLIRTLQTVSAIERIIPQDGGGFLGFGFDAEVPRFDRHDSSGRVLARLKHPSWLDTVPSLVSELRAVASPNGRNLAVGSFYSGRLMIFSARDSVAREVEAVETNGFPRPVTYSPNERMTVRRLPPSARPTIRWLTADDQLLYVLILGRHAQRGRIVDLYALRDGSYRGSWLLPEPVVAISATNDGIAALVSEPLPSLLKLVPVRER